MRSNPFLIAVLAIAISLQSSGQTDSTIQKTKPQFKLLAYYNSSLSYYGRTDSLRSSGFFPVAEFWPSPHFYITAAPVFTSNKAMGFEYAGSVATAGTRFGKEKEYSAHIYAVIPIYKDNSQL